MSVLIKNMKMPKTCAECDFCHWSNPHQTGMCDRCNDEPVCADFGTDYKITRARFCPLVEIPPHGRLIDADALQAYKVEKFGKRLLALDRMPTVIEAEEDQEE